MGCRQGEPRGAWNPQHKWKRYRGASRARLEGRICEGGGGVGAWNVLTHCDGGVLTVLSRKFERPAGGQSGSFGDQAIRI